jgi:hypothetical protein
VKKYLRIVFSFLVKEVFNHLDGSAVTSQAIRWLSIFSTLAFAAAAGAALMHRYLSTEPLGHMLLIVLSIGL